jgi:mono/diheme cytochrome c family protein
MKSKLRWTALLLLATLIVVSLVVAEDSSDEDVSAIAEHMHGHLDSVIAMKAAVISGNLAGVARPARWLGDHPRPSDLPEAWANYEEDMRSFARRAAAAQNLETAAAAVSDIGRVCGDCHIASGFVVSFGYSKPPPADLENTITQMQRHLWASARLWAGLIGPSNGAWASGASMLEGVDVNVSDITSDETLTPLVVDIVERLRFIGERSRAADDGETRSALYGEFLSQCANCHNLTGGGPRS